MYGIIAAMEEEIKEIKNIMSKIEEKNIFELTFFTGVINSAEVVLVEAGVGKVNASRVTQILIDKFNPKAIINVGSAAGCNDELEIGDIVIGDKLVQHDFDITAFNHPKGYISNVGRFIESDTNLIKEIKQSIKNIININFNVKVGPIASGDIFCTDIKMKNKIKEKFDAYAIEMEGAAIAQVCKLDNIPFVVIRSISDKPNGKNEITFDEFLEKASKNCAHIINEFFYFQREHQ